MKRNETSELAHSISLGSTVIYCRENKLRYVSVWKVGGICSEKDITVVPCRA